jgi:hypothetical protein
MPETLTTPPITEAAQPPPAGVAGEITPDLAAKPLIEITEPHATEVVPPDSNTETTPTSADTAAEKHDAEARYMDTELLGKSFRVRRSIQEAGTQSVKTWQGLKAKVRNALDTPGKAFKQFAYNHAKSSYERKDARLKAATSLRLQQPRQAKADSAKEAMEYRAGSLHDRVTRMEGRKTTVHENADLRRQEYVSELKERREGALARKAVRQQLRGEGATRRETRAIVAEIPTEHMDRLGKVAIVSETSQRKLSEAKQFRSHAEKEQSKTVARIKHTERHAETYDKTAEHATTSMQEISTNLLPVAEQYVVGLTGMLKGFEPGDPNHDLLAAEITKAQRVVDSYKSQITYLEGTAVSNRLKVEQAKGQLGGLRQSRRNDSKKAKFATRQLNRQRKINKQHRDQLDEAVIATLNSAETRKES